MACLVGQHLLFVLAKRGDPHTELRWGHPPVGNEGNWASRQLHPRVKVQSLGLAWQTASSLCPPPPIPGSWAGVVAWPGGQEAWVIFSLC